MFNKKLLAPLVALIALTGVSCGGGGGIGQASDTFVITAAHTHPEHMAMHDWQLIFQREVQANSNGRIVMNIFPNGQLGGDRELLEGIQAGDITMMGASTAPKAFFVPDLAVFDALFAHEDLESARRWWQDPAFRSHLGTIFREAGFHHLGGFDSGFRVLTTNVPIHSIDDVSGVRIRTSTNVYHVEGWRAIGANPTPLGISEVYMALQLGVVDAQDNPVDLTEAFGFFDHQRYAMEITGFFHINNYVMSPAFYDSLPPDLQRVVDEAAATATREAMIIRDREMLEAVRDTTERGIEWIPVSPELNSQFAERARTTWYLVQADVTPQTWDVFTAALERSQQ
ncbi:MAG: TRAP transporter substrate-binding protein [Spirochaetes bacterium]|nr:TRAP transporter substrate-binding protein [Spirochaetota bacterium]